MYSIPRKYCTLKPFLDWNNIYRCFKCHVFQTAETACIERSRWRVKIVVTIKNAITQNTNRRFSFNNTIRTSIIFLVLLKLNGHGYERHSKIKLLFVHQNV